jgi:hypothetical protein
MNRERYGQESEAQQGASVALGRVSFQSETIGATGENHAIVDKPGG